MWPQDFLRKSTDDWPWIRPSFYSVIKGNFKRVPGGSSQGTLWTLLASWFCDHHKGGLRLKTHLRKHKVLSIVLAQVQFVIKQSISARSVAFDLSNANPVSSSDFSNSWPSDPHGRFSSSVFSCPGRMFANSIDARLVATRTCMSLPCACTWPHHARMRVALPCTCARICHAQGPS